MAGVQLYIPYLPDFTHSGRFSQLHSKYCRFKIIMSLYRNIYLQKACSGFGESSYELVEILLRIYMDLYIIVH